MIPRCYAYPQRRRPKGEGSEQLHLIFIWRGYIHFACMLGTNSQLQGGGGGSNDSSSQVALSKSHSLSQYWRNNHLHLLSLSISSLWGCIFFIPPRTCNFVLGTTVFVLGADPLKNDDTELIYTVLYLSYTKINSPIFIFSDAWRNVEETRAKVVILNSTASRRL
jgi:hypothetical protein